MARVLYLAYHFPPIGGGGVQRNSKFVRYLPDFGHVPIVLTGPGDAMDRWTPADASLLADVGGGAIHRISVPEPAPSRGWRAAIERRLMRPTRFERWWTKQAVDLGTRVGRDADVIFASLVPYESAGAAAQLARSLGIPWIADLQDPWALDEMWLYPSRFHRKRDERRMRHYLDSAAVVVMNTPEAAVRVQRAFPELRGRVVSITNGYDAADFSDRAQVRSDGSFRIVHTGYLHTDQGYRLRQTKRARRILGGIAPIDILPRSHVYLLEAAASLIRARPDLEQVLEVVFAGVSTDLDRAVAVQSGVPTRFLGYVSHVESVELIRSADLLFLPMHDLPIGMRAGLTPGKTYEYLAAQRPILAAVPDGDARDLLEAAGVVRLTRPTDVDGMRAQLEEAVDDWLRGKRTPSVPRELLQQYERRELTRTLSEVVDRVVGS